MSDHEHDEHGGGAHEVDNMPSRRLFNLLFGLSALTVIACIGVVQLFNRQVDSIQGTRHGKVSFQLEEYREEMDALTQDWSVAIIDDDDGVASDKGGKGPHEAKRFRMPLSEARKRVLESPETLLKAQRPYRFWPNPDPNAPKAQPRPRPRPGARPVAPRGVVPTKPGAAPAKPGAVVPGGAAAPGAKPAVPAEGKAPAAPKGGEGKAPAAPKGGEGKAPAAPKGDEGKAPTEPAAPKGDGEGKAPN